MYGKEGKESGFCLISSKGKSKISECFQRQSQKNFEFCNHKNCTLTGVEDEDTFMAHQVQIFKVDEAEWEAIEWLAANPTRYKPKDSGSSVDIDHTVDLFELADCE